MNKVFEKILKRLEKEAYTTTDTVCGGMFEAIRLSSAQQIVQDVAEEYNDGGFLAVSVYLQKMNVGLGKI